MNSQPDNLKPHCQDAESSLGGAVRSASQRREAFRGEGKVSSHPHETESRYRSHNLAAAVGIAAVVSLLLLAGTRLIMPAKAFSKQTRVAGAATFHDKGCEHCHGVDGTGTDRGPALSDIGKRWTKDRIGQQIRNGGGGMPPFADALQPDEVRDLVDFLSAKRKAAKASKTPKDPIPAKASSDDSGI